jgi:hypothetical protein
VQSASEGVQNLIVYPTKNVPIPRALLEFIQIGIGNIPKDITQLPDRITISLSVPDSAPHTSPLLPSI